MRAVFIIVIDLTLIESLFSHLRSQFDTNQQNPPVLQNKNCIGSRPDPFRGGAYNLQLISTTPKKKGLVYETNIYIYIYIYIYVLLEFKTCVVSFIHHIAWNICSIKHWWILLRTILVVIWHPLLTVLGPNTLHSI